jgi:hypothetical protein
MSEPLRVGDVVGRFRDGVLVDTGVVQDIIRTARPETVLWTLGVKPQEGDDVRRILL